jgi:hypothetical protein
MIGDSFTAVIAVSNVPCPVSMLTARNTHRFNWFSPAWSQNSFCRFESAVYLWNRQG